MDRLRHDILHAGGFEALTPLQERMLRDVHKRVLLLAPTGTGKTLAFIIGLLKCLGKPTGRPQALVIVPSRELGVQVAGEMRRFAPTFRIATFYGGKPLHEEVNTLAGSRPDIVIATPGRLLDHLDRHTIDTAGLKAVVIDEVDKCLDLGFMPDIKRILKRIPKPGHLFVSSATPPPEADLRAIAGTPETLDFRDESRSPQPRIDVVEVPSEQKDKLDTLEALLDSLPQSQTVIVFANHRESAERIYSRLHADGFAAALYHGTLDQQNREIALETLRNGTARVLVATDLAARGLDVPGVGAVVHYHLPVSAQTFVHRNGRTARAGNQGTAYVIRHPEESQPEYMTFDRLWRPSRRSTPDCRSTTTATAVFNLGKKEKISRGDILGFLVKDAGLPAQQIGRIAVSDHYSTAAIPSSWAEELSRSARSRKIKGQRFRISFAGQ